MISPDKQMIHAGGSTCIEFADIDMCFPKRF